MAGAYGSTWAKCIFQIRGDLEQAEELYRKVSPDRGAVGAHLEGMAANYGNLGIISRIRGDLEQAEELYRKVSPDQRAVGTSGGGWRSDYGNLGTIAQIRGDLEQAEELHRKASPIGASGGAVGVSGGDGDGLRGTWALSGLREPGIGRFFQSWKTKLSPKSAATSSKQDPGLSSYIDVPGRFISISVLRVKLTKIDRALSELENKESTK